MLNPLLKVSHTVLFQFSQTECTYTVQVPPIVVRNLFSCLEIESWNELLSPD